MKMTYDRSILLIMSVVVIAVNVESSRRRNETEIMRGSVRGCRVVSCRVLNMLHFLMLIGFEALNTYQS